MGLGIFNKELRTKKKIRKFIQLIHPVDKSDRERCKYKVQVSGNEIDDLDSGPTRTISFSRDEFKETEEDAEELGKLEYANGNEVEIWVLVKRWKQ